LEVLSFQRLERLSWSLPWCRACSLRWKLISEVGFICVAEVKATCWHQVLVRRDFLSFNRLFSCTAISCSDAGVCALMSEQAVGTTPTEALVIEQGPKPPVITTESFNIAPHAPRINWTSRWNLALSQLIQRAFRCGNSDHCSLANKLWLQIGTTLRMGEA
jgi:hypothetical protein